MNPPTSGEDEEYSEGQSFGGIDVGDDFWGELDQLEEAERTGRSGEPSASASPQVSRAAVPDRSNGGTPEVITLDDDESDEPDDWTFGSHRGNKANVRVRPPPVPSSQPRPRPEQSTQVQEVIELSD